MICLHAFLTGYLLWKNPEMCLGIVIYFRLHRCLRLSGRMHHLLLNLFQLITVSTSSYFESQIHNGKRVPCRQICYLSTAFKAMTSKGKRHISESMWMIIWENMAMSDTVFSLYVLKIIRSTLCTWISVLSPFKRL